MFLITLGCRDSVSPILASLAQKALFVEMIAKKSSPYSLG